MARVTFMVHLVVHPMHPSCILQLGVQCAAAGGAMRARNRWIGYHGMQDAPRGVGATSTYAHGRAKRTNLRLAK